MYNEELVNDTYKVIESYWGQKQQTYLLNQENYSYILKNNKIFQSTYKTIHYYIKQISVIDEVYPNLDNVIKIFNRRTWNKKYISFLTNWSNIFN